MPAVNTTMSFKRSCTHSVHILLGSYGRNPNSGCSVVSSQWPTLDSDHGVKASVTTTIAVSGMFNGFDGVTDGS